SYGISMEHRAVSGGRWLSLEKLALPLKITGVIAGAILFWGIAKVISSINSGGTMAFWVAALVAVAGGWCGFTAAGLAVSKLEQKAWENQKNQPPDTSGE